MNKKIILTAIVLIVVAAAAACLHVSDDKETMNVGASVQVNGWTWSYDDSGDIIGLQGTGTTITASDWPSTAVSIFNNYAGSINCPNLTTITIPSKIKIIGSNAFDGCSSITTVTLQNGVEEINTRAFYGTSISSITIPASVVNIMPSAFASCSNLTSITVSSSNTNYTASGGLLYSKDMSLLVCAGGGKTGIISLPESVSEMSSSAFLGCSKVTHVTLPDSVAEIPDYAFQNCTSLRSVAFSKNVTSLGIGAFYGCSSLSEIELPWYIKTIPRNAFYGCSSLAEIDIPDSVTKIEAGAFQNCSSLQPIMFSEYVTNINSRAFAGCSSLDYVVISENTVVAANAFPSNTQILPYIEYTSYPTADMVVRHVSSYTYELSTSTEGKAIWNIGGKTLEGSTIQYSFASDGEYKITLNVYDSSGIKTHAAERIISVPAESIPNEDGHSLLNTLLIASAIAGIIAAVPAVCYIISSKRILILVILIAAVAAVILAAEAVL